MGYEEAQWMGHGAVFAGPERAPAADASSPREEPSPPSATGATHPPHEYPGRTAPGSRAEQPQAPALPATRLEEHGLVVDLLRHEGSGSVTASASSRRARVAQACGTRRACTRRAGSSGVRRTSSQSEGRSLGAQRELLGHLRRAGVQGTSEDGSRDARRQQAPGRASGCEVEAAAGPRAHP